MNEITHLMLHINIPVEIVSDNVNMLSDKMQYSISICDELPPDFDSDDMVSQILLFAKTHTNSNTITDINNNNNNIIVVSKKHNKIIHKQNMTFKSKIMKSLKFTLKNNNTL